MFKILDGRKSFYQWDLHQKLLVLDKTVTEVHFPIGEDRCPPVPVYEHECKRVVDVPNVLLQTAGVMHLYAFVKGNDGNRTIHSKTFLVKERPKPDDYIYTEQECWTTEEAVRRALLEAKEELVDAVRNELPPTGGISVTYDGNGHVTISTSSGVSVTDDGNGNVT